MTFLLLLVAINACSQSKQALKIAISNYSRCIEKSFTSGSPVFRYHMHNALSAQGYSYLEILKGMENLEADDTFRVATYRAWQKLYDQKVTLDFDLISIGMNSRDAQIMKEYIKKFTDQDRIGLEENQKLSTGNVGPVNIPASSFINLVLPIDSGKFTGKVAVLITIDDKSKVIKAVPAYRGTTIVDKVLWKTCGDAMLGAVLNQTAVNEGLKIGVVVFNFRVK